MTKVLAGTAREKGKTSEVNEYWYREIVRIEVQVDMPFQIGGGHGRWWYQRVCEWHGQMANEHIMVGCNSYEKVKTFKYLGSLLTNQNSIQEEINCKLKARNPCYYSVQILLSSQLLFLNLKIKKKNLKIKIYKTIILPFIQI